MSQRKSDRKRSIVVVVTLLCAVMPLGAEEIHSGEPLSLELVGANLEDVLIQFSELTGKVFAIDPLAAAAGGLEQQVDALYESTPWDEVLDEILAGAGWDWTLEGDVLWIHQPGMAPGGDRTFTGEPINLRLHEADLRLVMSTFSKITPFSIEVEPEIDSSVTVSFKGIPWDQALDLILRVNGLGFTHGGGLINVYRVTAAAGKQLLPPSGNHETDPSRAGSP